MIDLLLIRVGFVVGLADALRNDLRVTFSVTGVLAIRTLHTSGILKKFSTKRTTHDVVELLGNKLVTLLLVDVFFLLAHGTLTVETNVKGTTIFHLFGYLVG